MSAAAKLLGKQNKKAFTLLNLGKAILFVHRKSPSGEKQSRQKGSVWSVSVFYFY